MFCNNCGKKVDDDARFCRFCGEDLSKSDYEKTDEITDEITHDTARKSGFKDLPDYLKGFIIAGVIIVLAIVLRFSMFDLDYEYRKGNYENIAKEYDADSIEKYDRDKKLKIINSYVKMNRTDEVKDEINALFEGVSALDLNTPLEAKLYIIYLKNKVLDYDYSEPFLFITNEIKNSKVAGVLSKGKDEIAAAFESVSPKKLMKYLKDNAQKIDLNELSRNLKENFKNNQFINDFTETIDSFVKSASKYGNDGAREIYGLIMANIEKSKDKTNISWNFIKNEYKKNLTNLNEFFDSDKAKDIEKFLGKEKFEEIFKDSVGKTKNAIETSGEKISDAFDISKELIMNFIEKVKEYFENTSIYRYLKDTTSNLVDIFKENEKAKKDVKAR